MDILVKGIAFGNTGYANATRGLIKCLRKLDTNLKLESLNAYKKDEDYHGLQDILNKKDVRPKISLQVTVPFQLQRLAHTYNIGYTMFEPTTLPASFRACLNNCDEIWVPSKQNRESFSKCCDKPVFHVPLPIDTNKFTPHLTKLNIVNDNRFKFLSLGTWGFRKGWHLLIPAFLEEFINNEAILLIIINNGEYKTILSEIRRFRKASGKYDLPDIIYINQEISEDLLPYLYKEADVGVFPNLGEGLGLPLLEMMSVGKPVITSNGSAMLDYCNDENAFMIEVEHDKFIKDRYGMNSNYYDNLKWIEPKKYNIRHQMRKAFETPDLSRKGCMARQNALRYSYDNIIKIIKTRLEDAHGRIRQKTDELG